MEELLKKIADWKKQGKELIDEISKLELTPSQLEKVKESLSGITDYFNYTAQYNQALRGTSETTEAVADLQERFAQERATEPVQ